MTAKQIINTSVSPLRVTDTAEQALLAMEDTRLIHLPVVNEGHLWGIISEQDLLASGDGTRQLGQCSLSTGRIYVFDNQHLYDVIRTFSESKLTMIPVLTGTHHYLGLITLASMTGHLMTITAVGEPGGIIILEINEKDYCVSEIAQIVESNNARILSLYITSEPDSTRMDVTLKLSVTDIGPILQTFFRYNYLVKASWSDQDSYSDELKDRYDALMNYLSI